MKTRLRTAELRDIPDMLRIKNALAFNGGSAISTNGGFLLGSDEAAYREYVQHACCMLAEEEMGAVGFGIMLPDAVFRASEIWKKKDKLAGAAQLNELNNLKICYFEQLAVLPVHRSCAVMLAHGLATAMFGNGHDMMISTTVHAPIENRAAWPFLLAAGADKVARIEETYPGVGNITSDIWLLTRERFETILPRHPLYNRLIQQHLTP